MFVEQEYVEREAFFKCVASWVEVLGDAEEEEDRKVMSPVGVPIAHGKDSDLAESGGSASQLADYDALEQYTLRRDNTYAKEVFSLVRPVEHHNNSGSGNAQAGGFWTFWRRTYEVKRLRARIVAMIQKSGELVLSNLERNFDRLDVEHCGWIDKDHVELLLSWCFGDLELTSHEWNLLLMPIMDADTSTISLNSLLSFCDELNRTAKEAVKGNVAARITQEPWVFDGNGAFISVWKVRFVDMTPDAMRS
jgi:hypothetical protein